MRRYRDRVYRLVASVVGPQEADDVAQDTFLRAFHTLRDFRGDGPFAAWLLRIARNTALNAAARRRPLAIGDPRDRELGSDAHLPASDSAYEKTPAETLEDRERRQRFLAKMRELGGDYTVVLVLREFEELSYEEIARILDVPIGTVKTHLHRARHKLIDLLRSNTYDWGLPAKDK